MTPPHKGIFYPSALQHASHYNRTVKTIWNHSPLWFIAHIWPLHLNFLPETCILMDFKKEKRFIFGLVRVKNRIRPFESCDIWVIWSCSETDLSCFSPPKKRIKSEKVSHKSHSMITSQMDLSGFFQAISRQVSLHVRQERDEKHVQAWHTKL